MFSSCMIIMGILFLVFGLIVGGNIIPIGMSIIFFAIGIPLAIKKSKKKNRELQKLDQENKLAFYNECLSNNIKYINSDKERQKAALIAQKYNIPFTDIELLFKEARHIAVIEAKNERQKSIQDLKDEETRRCASLDKYSDLYGRDKRIEMINDELRETRASIERSIAAERAVISASQQKEQDWAIHGGIASGIAGPGAGVATALNIQAKNAEIRAQNQANLQALKPIVMSTSETVGLASKRAKSLEEDLKNAQTRLVFEDDVTTCLSKLKFQNTTVEVSKTGTCIVSTNVIKADSYIIFDDIEATIDGTIIANIYDQDALIGTANLVLPRYGISNRKSYEKLQGMCLFCGKPGKTYRVEFDAVNLWAMEP